MIDSTSKYLLLSNKLAYLDAIEVVLVSLLLNFKTAGI